MILEPLIKSKIKKYTEADYYEGTTIDHKAVDIEDVKSAVELLRLELCEGNNCDEDDNKMVCPEALIKRSYRKRRCEKCEKIDNIFPAFALRVS